MKLAHAVLLLLFPHTCVYSAEESRPEDSMMRHLVALADPLKGIGMRVAATNGEQRAAQYIASQWGSQGYEVTQQDFRFAYQGRTLASQNVFIRIPGKSDREVLIGAHYDSTGAGSNGVIDNAASVALLLTLSQALKTQYPNYTVTLVAFGAEEVSLQGSKAFAAALTEKEINRIAGMINLDTIAGGDVQYIHSAHSKPYSCATSLAYSSESALRNELIKISQNLFADNAHRIHPTISGYPQGETGGWSDHAAFACLGIPIAYFEATNFAINGKRGFDGYSQVTHTTLWDCFDHDKMSACTREEETKWGNIWHTQYDTLDAMNRLFPQRIETQLRKTFDVIRSFLVVNKQQS